MNKSKILGTVLTALIFILPGLLIYLLEGNPQASTIFLTFTGALISCYLLFRRDLGLEIDEEIRKQHSWKQ